MGICANVSCNLSLAFQHCTCLVLRDILAYIFWSGDYQSRLALKFFISSTFHTLKQEHWRKHPSIGVYKVLFYPHSPLFEVQRTNFYSGPRWIFAKTLAFLAATDCPFFWHWRLLPNQMLDGETFSLMLVFEFEKPWIGAVHWCVSRIWFKLER